MAYTDGLTVLGKELAAVQVETAAADVEDYVMPCNVTILQFGVLITEDFTAHAIDPVVALQKKPGIGGSATDLVTLTLSSAATLKAGDGTKEAQTAITASTDLDDDDVVLANPQSFPITVKSGEVITLRVKTASGSAGGAIIPFAIVRVDGLVDARQTNVWVDSAAL
jgi:hypothetical protein